MIYVMSQKFFMKYVTRLAEPNPYFIIDGENYAVSGDPNKVRIATKFNRAHSVGNFSPEQNLYQYLLKKERGDDINEDKFERRIHEYLTDKAFISSITQAFKALIAMGTRETLNIFVVLPNLVYKYLGNQIVLRMRRVAKLPFTCVFSQAELREDWRRLRKLLNEDQLRDVDIATKRIERQWDLKYSETLEDYDDYDD